MLQAIIALFTNPYYDECVAQRLAPVCHHLQVPSWQAVAYTIHPQLLQLVLDVINALG